jgi:hypothetical protein
MWYIIHFLIILVLFFQSCITVEICRDSYHGSVEISRFRNLNANRTSVNSHQELFDSILGSYSFRIYKIHWQNDKALINCKITGRNLSVDSICFSDLRYPNIKLRHSISRDTMICLQIDKSDSLYKNIYQNITINITYGSRFLRYFYLSSPYEYRKWEIIDNYKARIKKYPWLFKRKCFSEFY